MSTMILMVVSRDNPGLYDYAVREFADSDEIKVVLDRRIGDRRDAGNPLTANVAERRRSDRRRYAVDHRLRTIGWAFVRDGVVVRTPLEAVPTSA
jgi:hypothetical protein